MFVEFTRGVDIVLRYETLSGDLENAFERAGMPANAQIPVVNRTEERIERNYRSCYSKTAARAVAFAYSEDLKKYGYRF